MKLSTRHSFTEIITKIAFVDSKYSCVFNVVVADVSAQNNFYCSYYGVRWNEFAGTFSSDITLNPIESTTSSPDPYYHYTFMVASSKFLSYSLQRFRGWHEVHPDVHLGLSAGETKGTLQLIVRGHQQGGHGAVSRWPLSGR